MSHLDWRPYKASFPRLYIIFNFPSYSSIPPSTRKRCVPHTRSSTKVNMYQDVKCGLIGVGSFTIFPSGKCDDDQLTYLAYLNWCLNLFGCCSALPDDWCCFHQDSHKTFSFACLLYHIAARLITGQADNQIPWASQERPYSILKLYNRNHGCSCWLWTYCFLQNCRIKFTKDAVFLNRRFYLAAAHCCHEGSLHLLYWHDSQVKTQLQNALWLSVKIILFIIFKICHSDFLGTVANQRASTSIPRNFAVS